MPRKAFVADLQEAIREFRSPNFSDLKSGDEDGTITFQYYDRGGDTQGTTIQAIVPGKVTGRLFLSIPLARRTVYLSMSLGSIGLREADTLLDVGDYPTSHNYILCTASQHVPASIS